jgi:hypothetical protein
LTESELIDALRRAARRAVYHMLRAGVEGLRAVEAIVDELGKVGEEKHDDSGPERVTVE